MKTLLACCWSMRMLAFLVLACGPLSFARSAETLTVTLISANDGDTCRVRDHHGRQYRIRLFGIDAPESDQPYGPEAGQALREILGSGEFKVKLTGDETYGRKVGRIYVDDVYINPELVADGWAWHYASFTSGEEAAAFTARQAEARDGRIGLWADTNPVRPDCWRRGDRDGDCRPDHLQPFALRVGRDTPGFRLGPTASRTNDLLNLATREASVAAQMSPVDRFRAFRSSTAARDSNARGLAPQEETALRRIAAGHTVHGKPTASDNRFRFTPSGRNSPVDGITELRRTAFTVGHYDRYRLPAWVAMKWTKADYERGVGVSLNRPQARIDNDLPEYARGGTSFEYNTTGLQRGHMAPDDLMESWGGNAVAEAARMSNFVPQLEGRNHAVWTLLEIAVKEIVADDEDTFDIETVWTVAGPIFLDGEEPSYVGDPGTRVPDATYKIVAWTNAEGKFTARAYVIGQLADNVDLREHLKSVDEVESLTGLDFFSGLADSEENDLERATPSTMWE